MTNLHEVKYAELIPCIYLGQMNHLYIKNVTLFRLNLVLEKIENLDFDINRLNK